MQIFIRAFIVLIVVMVFGVAEVQARSYSPEVAGWLPCWSDTAGIEDMEDNMRDIDILYPFVYEVTADGKLVDKANIEERQWKNLFKKAREKRVDIIPTIMWFNGDQIHEVLSDKKKRKKHIEEIVDMVDDGRFDGVNIDYEDKNAATIDYFSDFLEELKDELGRDTLTCTIEARTPPDSWWKEIPKVITWANDYEEMNKHCDWVEIMAYDQQRADLKLNKE